MKGIVLICSLLALLSLFSCDNKAQSGNTNDDSTDGSNNTLTSPFDTIPRQVALTNIYRYDTFSKACTPGDSIRYKPDSLVMRLMSLSKGTINALLQGSGDRIRFCVAMDSTQKLTVLVQVRSGKNYSYYDMNRPKAARDEDDDLCPQPPLCGGEIEK